MNKVDHKISNFILYHYTSSRCASCLNVYYDDQTISAREEISVWPFESLLNVSQFKLLLQTLFSMSIYASHQAEMFYQLNVAEIKVIFWIRCRAIAQVHYTVPLLIHFSTSTLIIIIIIIRLLLMRKQKCISPVFRVSCNSTTMQMVFDWARFLWLTLLEYELFTLSCERSGFKSNRHTNMQEKIGPLAIIMRYWLFASRDIVQGCTFDIYNVCCPDTHCKCN